MGIISPYVGNQMEKNMEHEMENEMETEGIQGFKELILGYHIGDTIVIATYTHYGNLG